MTRNPRLRYDAVEGADTLFTDSFVDYLLGAARPRCTPRSRRCSHARADALERALRQGVLPRPPRRRRHRRRLEGAAGARRSAEAGHRDLGPVLDHLHVHQRAQPGPGGRARRGRPRRRRGLGRSPADRHRARGAQPGGRGAARAVLPRRRAQARVQDRRGRAAVLHAPRARHPPRRARRHRRRHAGERRRARHRAHALPRRTRPGRARPGHLLLPAQARVRAPRRASTASSST